MIVRKRSSKGYGVMIEASGRVTGKGQVQVPKKIGDFLGIKSGDGLVFRLSPHRTLTFHVRKARRLSELAGCLPPKRPFPGIAEEEDAARRKYAGKAAWMLKNGN